MPAAEHSDVHRMRIEALFRAFQSVKPPADAEIYDGGDLSAKDIRDLIHGDHRWLDPTEVSWYVQSLPNDGMGASVDDFRYLLPGILTTWSREFLATSYKSSLLENLTPALGNTRFLTECLSQDLEEAVYSFMRGTLLDRMAQEESLHIVGMNRTYGWFHQFAAYGVIGRDIPRLWTKWWEKSSLGHAIAAVQYASCLVCPDDENPVFAPWTCDKGGGVPQLWEYGSIGLDQRWRSENTEFLSVTLSPTFVRDRLEAANRVLTMSGYRNVVEQLILAANTNPDLLETRCTKLPALLATPSDVGGQSWESEPN